jgi:two-component system cell cycle response regulator
MTTEIRILLVDDEEFYLRIFSDILASRRFFVRTAQSGEEALALLQQERFDILITDLLMKGIDGLELTERAREHFPSLDIIVITQRDDVRLAVRSMRMGVFEYLVKPVSRDELLLTLDRLLERRKLVDQQNKLLDESIQYLQAQTVYRRCLEILSTLDFENLCEMILRHMLQATGAQGGVVWLTSPEERPASDGTERFNLTGYRGLINVEEFPSRITIGTGPWLDAVLAGVPFFANPSELDGSVSIESSEPSEGGSLFVPLVAEGVPLGVLVLLDKLREDFTERDQNIARTMAEFTGIALKNSRRFKALERLGLRDQGATAYNLTYFIDYAGKEIYKARRFGRSFSLVTVSIDRFEFLREHFKPEICSRMSRKLAESISRVVRDSDILARVSDHEYYLLLPETDSLGARMFVRRSQAAFSSDSFIAEMSRDYPISVTMGAATFPLDGQDFDQLLIACRDEAEQTQRSLFRRLHLEQNGLWDVVAALVGQQSDHEGALSEASELFRLAEESEAGSAHCIFDADFLDAVEEEICRQAVDVTDRRAVIYALGGTIVSQARSLERMLEGCERARALLIGKNGEGNQPSEFASVTRVFVDDERVDNHRLFLVLGERLAYAFCGRRGSDDRLFGFHSCDQYLVESLISKLQDHFNFQRVY